MEEPSVLDYLKARLALLSGRGDSEAARRVREIEKAAGLLVEREEQANGRPDEGPAVQSALELEEGGHQAAQPEVQPRPAGEAGELSHSHPPGEMALQALESEAPEPQPLGAQAPEIRREGFPIRSLAALLLALGAQFSLEPPTPSPITGVLLYLLAALAAVWAYWSGELRFSAGEWATVESQPLQADPASKPLVRRPAALIISIPLLLGAFILFGGNRFNTFNVLLWIFGIFFFVEAFWQPEEGRLAWTRRISNTLSKGEWNVRITVPALLLVAASALAVFFRVYRLNSVPPEMISDHAEKLLDVYDVLHGQTSIFFPRNTGREGLQMYLTAGVANLLGTGLSYLSLKIGTALAGLLTLPFIYLLGKETGGRRAGLLAMIFAGIAYWPNVISRVGLRFPLYALFAAPTLYFLVRGLRRGRLNDFILAGLALGVGLHGYTPIRIVPLVVIFAVGLYLAHQLVGRLRRRRREAQEQGSPAPSFGRQAFMAIFGLVLVGLVSLVVFLPLLRFWFEAPELFAFRSFSRLGPVERALPGPAWEIFLRNVWRAEIAPFWDNGEIWVNSVTHRPALDVVSAALYGLGSLLLLVRYLRRRDWLDLFLLLSVPLLMLPSSLSLAFPDENPSLNRMSAAIVPIFVIVGLGLDGILSALEGKRLRGKAEDWPSSIGVASRVSQASGRSLWSWGAAGLLLLLSATQNYDLVFSQYYNAYLNASWNSSEMGQVIAQFAGTIGRGENAWVVAYPHWVDTRLVGIHAGFPLRDFAIWPENLEGTLSVPGPKLFIVRPDDKESLETLGQLYPQGSFDVYLSTVPEHNFYVFFVPG